jgi:hypothetical protein
MEKFSLWLNKKLSPKNENVSPDLFSAVTDPAKHQEVMNLIAQNPDLLTKLEKFKQENAKSFDSSVRNFNTNSIELRHLMKLAEGKPLTFYDWM